MSVGVQVDNHSARSRVVRQYTSTLTFDDADVPIQNQDVAYIRWDGCNCKEEGGIRDIIPVCCVAPGVEFTRPEVRFGPYDDLYSNLRSSDHTHRVER